MELRGTAKRVGPAAMTFRQSSDGRPGKVSLTFVGLVPAVEHLALV
jgi:hypothetical protein